MKFGAVPSISGGLGVALPEQAGELRTDNRVATLEAPKAEFEASWRQWLAWEKFGEKE
jgi:hypothetical protein